MKYVLGMLLIVLLAGCSGGNASEPEEPFYGIRGTVVEEDEQRVLVVSNEKLGREDMENPRYNAAWLSGIHRKVEVGQQVEVAFDGGVNDSYPLQAQGKSVKQIQDEQPEGAALSREEAVRQALQQAENLITPTVLEVEYLERSSEWRILIYENASISENSEVEVRVQEEANG